MELKLVGGGYGENIIQFHLYFLSVLLLEEKSFSFLM